MATCIFCSTFIAAPGHCSPSLSVVSKICICSFIYSKNVKRSFLRELRTENVPVTESFLWRKSRQPFTSLAPERLTGAYQDIFTDLPSEKQQQTTLQKQGIHLACFYYKSTLNGERDRQCSLKPALSRHLKYI